MIPVALILLIWWLRPHIGRLLERRSFTIKVAGFELSAQEATDQLRSQVDDLQRKVAALVAATGVEVGDAPGAGAGPGAGPGGEAGTGGGSGPMSEGVPGLERLPARHILWVDDEPAGNAVLMAGFRDAGIEVTTARSTAEAMALLMELGDRVGAVVSDQGRVEDGRLRLEAGTDLVRQMAEAGMRLPVAIFTSARGARGGGAARKAGAEMVTSSATDLRRFVERHVGATGAD